MSTSSGSSSLDDYYDDNEQTDEVSSSDELEQCSDSESDLLIQFNPVSVDVLSSSSDSSTDDADMATPSRRLIRRPCGRPRKRRRISFSRRTSPNMSSASPASSGQTSMPSTPTTTTNPPPDWSEDPSLDVVLPLFLGNSEIHIFENNDDCPSPYEVFEQFFDKDFYNIVKFGTNQHARQLKRSSTNTTGVLKNWEAVTLDEVKSYLAIMLRTGLVKKTEMHMYWSKNKIFHDTFCSERMSRNRFQAISSMLHIGDNSTFVPFGSQGHDPLHKIRPFVDYLQQKCRSVYTPGRNISLDEATCPYKGRLKFKVYNKDKPHKWGIKLFELCESKSGYCFEFEIFCGLEKEQTKSKTDQLVMDIMAPHLDKGYHLFMDRYYSSPTLYLDLALRNTLATGTCMGNRRGLPTKFLGQKLKRGEMVSCKKEGLMALKWVDKKDVVMLSTACNNKVSTVQVNGPFGLHYKEKPKSVLLYNENMGGVDLSDQYLSYYASRRKTLKWWKKLFFHMLTLGIVNASIINNKLRKIHGKPSMPLLEFMCEVISSLAPVDDNDDDHVFPLPKTDRLVAKRFGHFPEKIPSPSGSRIRRVCKVCSDTEKFTAKQENRKKNASARKETSIWCPVCKVALCVDKCFAKYHTVSKYDQ